MARAQTIQIYLPSGNPAGIRVASITTRTVRVFEVPRSLLGEFLKRSESGQVGVYYLFGGDGDDAREAYIGQTGNVGVRLQQHTSSKDFWTKAMVAVSLTNEWTSTHVAYLEWLSIRRAVEAGRYQLENGNKSTNPHTPEPLEADCREFLDTIAVLLATLGAPILERVQSPATTRFSAAEPPVAQSGAGAARGVEPAPELLYFREAGCSATGYLVPEGLLVLAGATGRADVLPSVPDSTVRLRSRLLSLGIAEPKDGRFQLVKDHLFGTPSAAGGFLNGGSNNGRKSWKNSVGQNINEIEAYELDAAVAAADASAVGE